MNPQRSPPSRPALINCVFDFFVSERLETFAFSNLLLELPKSSHRRLHLCKASVTLWNNSRNRFVMLGDDNLFGARAALEEFSEPGFCVESSDGCHDHRISRLTSRRLVETNPDSRSPR